jgi:transcription antitermination factor NusG
LTKGIFAQHTQKVKLEKFVGRVSETHREQRKVTVLLSYFGKETPFVFDFLQVEKIAPFLP